MEKLSDLLGTIRERLSNPIFFSFIIAWIFCNPEIVVALIWYDPSQLEKEGFKSIFQFIQIKSGYWSTLFLPILCALGYTIFNPIIKNFISAFRAWNLKWGVNWTLRISGGSNVPIDKYLKLRDNLDRRTQYLEKIITSENITQQELDETKTALLKAQTEQGKLSDELAKSRSTVDNFRRIDFLDGDWICTTYLEGKSVEQNIHISNNIVYLVNDNNMQQMYFIHNFFYDNRSSELTFTLMQTNQQPAILYSINTLNYKHNSLTGTEYRVGHQGPITYKKPRTL